MRILNIIVGVVAGLGYLYGGLWLVNWNIDQLRRAGESRNWPQVEGVVVDSAIEERSGGERRPHVEYAYTVDGIEYTSRQISFDIFDKPGGVGRVESIVRRYPVNSKVTVYRDPNKPAVAILEPEDCAPFYAPLFMGIFLAGAGGLTTVATIRWSVRGQRVPGARGQLRRPQVTERIMWRTTLLSSFFLYCILQLVPLDSGFRETAVLAFGPQPLGMPNLAFVLLLQTVVYLPVPPLIWHWPKLMNQSRLDGGRFGLLYVLNVGTLHPELRRSQLVFIAGSVYLLVFFASWIVYTSILGI